MGYNPQEFFEKLLRKGNNRRGSIALGSPLIATNEATLGEILFKKSTDVGWIYVSLPVNSSLRIQTGFFLCFLFFCFLIKRRWLWLWFVRFVLFSVCCSVCFVRCVSFAVLCLLFCVLVVLCWLCLRLLCFVSSCYVLFVAFWCDLCVVCRCTYSSLLCCKLVVCLWCVVVCL